LPRAGHESAQNLARGGLVPSQKRERVAMRPLGQFLDVIKNRIVENRCLGGRFRLFAVTRPANE
jgi:hypothetical protein